MKNMRNVFFSVVVICTLAVAGIGGTLANFSDSEEEVGDRLQAGSMDLQVEGRNDPLAPFSFSDIVPELLYDITKTVSNNGTIDGYLWIHFKNVQSLETDPSIPHDFMPEPESVAENGGKVGQVIVPGVGDNVSIADHLEVEIRYDGQTVNLTKMGYDANGDGKIKLSELESFQIPIPLPWPDNVLPKSGSLHEINYTFRLQDVDEDDLIAAGLLLDPGTGYGYFDAENTTGTLPHDWKWDHWPSNAMMGDTVQFDILYELLMVDP